MTPHGRLSELATGGNPALILRLPSGFVVLGASQFLPGYCLLLADPFVEKLNDLDADSRGRFLDDMTRVGDAVLAVTGCLRINYSIYGNLDPFLHAHIWPRYDWENDAYRTLPPFLIPSESMDDPERAFDPAKHRDLQDKLRLELS